MNNYEQTLLHYATKLLTDDDITLITDNDIPLYGEQGLRRYLGEISIEAFIKLYFYEEFTLPFADIHLDMIADLQRIMDGRINGEYGDKLARAIPRGHAKSTFYSRILPIHGLLYGWSQLTVLLGNNDDAAKRLVANIKNAIETNAAIQQDFPQIKGDYWGNEKLTTFNGATLTSFGVGSGSIRGVSTGEHRPSLIILDDIDDNRSVRSAVELANNKEWLDKDVIPLGDSIGFTTSFIAVGTIIRRTSLMQYILNSAAFKSRIESAVISFADNQALWNIWKEHIINSARNGNQPTKPNEDTFYQENKQEMLQGVQMLWNRPDAYWYAMMVKLQNEAAFWSELQNAPKDSDSTFGAIEFIDLSTIDEREYELLAVLDTTVKGTKSNDYSSFVEILFNKKRKEMIVAYADVEQRSYAETINAIVARVKSRGRRYDAFWVEENSAGAVIKDLLAERFRKERIPLAPVGLYSSIPKNERINSLTEYINRKQLFMVNKLPVEAMRELQSWPLSQHDDFLDSVSICVLKLKDLKLIDLIQLPDIYGATYHRLLS